MAENKRVLSVRNLEVKYITRDETVEAVNGVSFDLNYGESLGLVGETGAGKTTIAKAIMRILPSPPARITGGEIILDDEVNLAALSDEDMRKYRGNRISMVFQDPMTALNPVIKVGNQIAAGIRIHQKCSKAEALKRAKEMLELVGIPGSRAIEYPHQFSGGMKQRVVIAMALACDPVLLLADEPTTALDVTIQAQILDLLQSLQKKLGTAVIMITHDLGVIAGMCSRVLVMYGGVVVEEGTVREIFYEPKHPYTWGLLRSIPQKSGEKRKLIPIPGSPPDLIAPPPGCPFVARCPYAMNICNSALPEMTRLSQTHCARCRLLDEGAPRIVWEGNRE